MYVESTSVAVLLTLTCSDRIAVFSVTVLRDERVVIVAEQRPGCSEDEVSYLMYLNHYD